MAKIWSVLILSALTACLSTIPNTTHVLTPSLAIHDALAANVSPSHWSSRHRTSVPGYQFRKANCFEDDVNYQGYDLRKVEDGTIRHPHACQHMCAQTPVCAYWTYVPETSSCYLKTQGALQGKTCRSSAVSGPRTCPPPYDSCYETNIDYYGSDEKSFVDHQVLSAEECHLFCLAFPACHYWTWVSADRNCYLKNDHAPNGRRRAPGSTSGPRHCVATFPAASGGNHEKGCGNRTCYEDGCYDYNVLYTGTTIEDNTAIHDPLDCQCLCQQHPSCGGFSYLPTEKKCMLKPSQGTAIFQTDAVSGPKFCYTPDCTIRDVEYYGKNIGNSSASSFPDCHELCQSNSLCSAVTFHEASKQCSLIQRAEHAKGFVSGPKWCTSSGREYNDRRGPATATGVAYLDSPGDSICHDAGLAYTSKPFSVKHSNSPELCQKHCQADSRCQFFTYFLFAQTCLLHDNEGQRVPNDTAASGPRVCPPSIACFYEDVEVHGKEVGRCTTENAAACQRTCQRNELCSFFAYHSGSKLCSQRQHRGPASGTTSAPVFCGIHDDDVVIRHERPADWDVPPPAGLQYPTLTEPLDDCFDVGLYYDSVMLEEAITKSSNDCQQLCEKDRRCSVFSFFRETGICLLQLSEGNQLLKQDAVSGPWKCGQASRTPECLVLGEYVGDVVVQDESEPTITLPGPPAECLLSCMRTAGCNFFTYGKKDTPCELYKSVSKINSSSLSVSGPVSCTARTRNPCLQDGVTCKMDQVISQKFANDLDDCIVTCQKDQVCEFFSYNESSKQCSFFKSCEYVTDKTSVSGAKFCFSPTFAPTAFNFAFYYSSAYRSQAVKFYQECYKVCEADADCKFFTFRDDTNNCRLHDRPGLPMEDPDHHGVAGPVHFLQQTVLEACINHDVRYVGEPLQFLTDVEELTDCRESCRNCSGCKYYTYLDVDQTCALFKSRRGFRIQRYAESGWRDCPPKEVCTSENTLDGTKYANFGLGFVTSSACEHICDDYPHCNIWGYGINVKKCFTSTITEAAPLYISGPVVCDETVHPIWLSAWGGPFPKANSQDSNSCPVGDVTESLQEAIDQCQQDCQRNWNCRSFSVTAADEQCHLNETVTAPTNQKGDIFCPAWPSPPPFSCRVENVIVRGDPTTEEKTESLEECVKLCARTSGSTYYSFDTVTKHCSCGFHEKEPASVVGGMKACMA